MYALAFRLIALLLFGAIAIETPPVSAAPESTSTPTARKKPINQRHELSRRPDVYFE